MRRPRHTLFTLCALALFPGCEEAGSAPPVPPEAPAYQKGDDGAWGWGGLWGEEEAETEAEERSWAEGDEEEGLSPERGEAQGDALSALWPLPTLEEALPEPCPAAQSSQWYFQYVDNLCEEKVWPSEGDRERMCPVIDSDPIDTLPDGTIRAYRPSSEPVVWETDRLAEHLPEGMRMVVILVKRIEGVPHYRYLSNGAHDLVDQPWSTTKVFAAANAAATLRMSSNGLVGLDASAGGYPLGDLVTSVCAYDEAPFSSNSLGCWFHDIGGRERAQEIVGGAWLERPDAERFGGNYGAAPPEIPYVFITPDDDKMTVLPDLSGGYTNALSMHTLAEGMKRIALHREEPSQRLPGLEWTDAKILLYGAEDSEHYGNWGGMTQDTAIHIQAGYDMDYIEARSQGQWRIFSKLGLGTEGQFLNMGYACWPAIDEAGAPIEGLGREFIIAAHLDTGGDTWAGRDRLFTGAYRKVIRRLVEGVL